MRAATGRAFLTAVAVAVSGPAATAQAPAGATVLDVPYLTQDELLCGGASAAMVLRYWGMQRVLPTDFSHLVSRSAGGMRAGDLAVYLSDLGWDPILFSGRFEEVRRHVRLGRPVITLIEVEGGRFHYVVVTGELGEQLVVHDPAASPFQLMSRTSLQIAWKRTGGLSLLVLPTPGRAPNVRPLAGAAARLPESARELAAACRPTLSQALGLARRGRTDEAASMLANGDCAGEPAFLRELAGLRLRQRNLEAAASLASAAIEADPTDRHAVETLATARFLDDAPLEALDAWNRVDRPTIDLIRIAGLRKTKQRPATDLLGLRGGEVLRRRSLLLADRRLADLPAAAATRLSYVPTGGGRADIVANVAERSGLPTTTVPLATSGLRTALQREVALTAVSPLGRGETWSGAWRWWTNRPRVAFGFAGPAVLGPPAVWTLDAAWERESFGPGIVGPDFTVDERTGAAAGASVWMEPWLRVHVSGGFDDWVVHGGFARAGAGFDIRLAEDRLGFSANADTWSSIEGGPGFVRLAADAAWTTSTEFRGLVFTARSGIESVGPAAPATVWPGAGAGFARQTLLRAHSLLSDGVVTGRAFDRHLATGSAEVVYWLPLGSGLQAGGAAFLDVARTWGVRPGESLADAGIGVRVGSSAREAVLRIDVATGLNNSEFAVSAGWWIPAAFR